MRVLWVFDYLAPAWQQVASRLAATEDISLEIMARYDSPPRFSTSIPLTPLTCRHKIDAAARKAIRDQVRNGDYDVVHAYTSKNLANLIAAVRGLKNKPKIIGYRGAISRLRRLDPSHWITFWHPAVDKITCVSRATEEALLDSNIAPTKLAAVNEGCDPGGMQPVSKADRDDFRIPPGAFVVGTVANMRPVKGIDLLLEAAFELTDLPNLYYLLIGKVIDSRIKRLAADPRLAGRVRLAGPRKYGCRYAELFDVFASPSRMEGFGIAVLEAMVQRTCPLVSNVGGLTELVRHERDGIVVPPESPAEIAAAIRRLHADNELTQQLADSAYRRSLSEFSIAAWTRRLEDLYREVAGDALARAA